MNVNVLMGLVLILIIFAWYSVYRLKNKCLVVYTRITSQELEKYVKLKARHFEFDGKKFDLIPGRQRLKWKNVFFGLFGTWVVAYHLVWYSRFPEDSRIYGIVAADTPEVRHDMNQEEKFRAYNRAESQRNLKKETGWAKWLPWIAILGVLIAIALIFFQSQDITIIKKTLQNLLTQGK